MFKLGFLDSVEDANFVKKSADSAILRLTAFIDATKATLEDKTLRSAPLSSPPLFLDRWFLAAMQKAVKETKEHYDNLMFREALKIGFFDLSRQWGVYQVGLGKVPPMRELALLYLEVQVRENQFFNLLSINFLMCPHRQFYCLPLPHMSVSTSGRFSTSPGLL